MARPAKPPLISSKTVCKNAVRTIDIHTIITNVIITTSIKKARLIRPANRTTRKPSLNISTIISIHKSLIVHASAKAPIIPDGITFVNPIAKLSLKKI